MKIAVTGATGFLGRYLVARLASEGSTCRCWYRPESDRSGFEPWEPHLQWVPGQLGDNRAIGPLLAGCDAVVHAALHRPGGGFRGGEGDRLDFVAKNVLGTLQLIEAARQADVRRFVFISTCAVHERILADRLLDETHPTWATSHYGAHKAAIEQFVHSYGFGEGFSICALRPTGIYGIARPVEQSRWFELVRAVARGETVTCHGGGKEVHASDVARAVEILLSAEGVAGEVYNCCDRYVSQYEVASIAKRLSASPSEIRGEASTPKHPIVTEKLERLGMTFGGPALLEHTIQQMLDDL
jgi:nucleoside-diphosphate-sugar epimerase